MCRACAGAPSSAGPEIMGSSKSMSTGPSSIFKTCAACERDFQQWCKRSWRRCLNGVGIQPNLRRKPAKVLARVCLEACRGVMHPCRLIDTTTWSWRQLRHAVRRHVLRQCAVSAARVGIGGGTNERGCPRWFIEHRGQANVSRPVPLHYPLTAWYTHERPGTNFLTMSTRTALHAL